MAIDETQKVDPLAQRISKARAVITNQAGATLREIARAAVNLEMKDIAQRINTIAEQLASEQFKLIIAGRFKNGKSTLMNALLGKPTQPVPELAVEQMQTQGQGPMPTDDLPCTATLTSISYADRPGVRVWYFDGKYEDWSLARYLREAVVKDDSEENQKFFSRIRQFELGFPAELCKSGVTLYDSPGLSDVEERDIVTQQAVQTADAAIVVFSSRAIAGMDELDFVKKIVIGTNTRPFFIVNMFDGRRADERFKTVVWNKVVKDILQGPPYEGQDPLSRDIYFVDARKAAVGKLNGNAQLVAESGLATFEARLGNFLLKDRYYVHLQKFLYRGTIQADGILQHIEQRRAALEQDEQKLRQAYEEIKPKLEAIRARREKLPTLIASYRTSCQRDLKTSFEQMLVQLRISLPTAFMDPNVHIPSMKTGVMGVFDQFRQKKLCQEATELCNQMVLDALKNWSEKEAPRILQARIESLIAELSDEVSEIARTYDTIHFQLTGWRGNADGPKGVVGTTERVLSGIAGIFVGDFTVLLGPAGGGWRSLAGALAGNIGMHIVLGLVGLSGAVIFWPAIVAGMIGSLIWGGSGLEGRIKKKTLDYVMPELQNIPAQFIPLIDKEIARTFNMIEQNVMEQVLAVIVEEEQNIQTMLDMNRRNQAEKVKMRAQLVEARGRVTKQRDMLKDLEARARQMA